MENRVERRFRYQPGAIWLEIDTYDELVLVRREEDGFLSFKGRSDPIEEREVIWSGR